MTAAEVAKVPAERERLEAAARAFAVHFNDPVLLFPDLFTLEGLRLVVAWHAAAYVEDLGTFNP